MPYLWFGIYESSRLASCKYLNVFYEKFYAGRWMFGKPFTYDYIPLTWVGISYWSLEPPTSSAWNTKNGPYTTSANVLSQHYRSSTPTCSITTSSSATGADCSLLRVFSSFCVFFSSSSGGSSRCGSAPASRMRSGTRHQFCHVGGVSSVAPCTGSPTIATGLGVRDDLVRHQYPNLCIYQSPPPGV